MCFIVLCVNVMDGSGVLQILQLRSWVLQLSAVTVTGVTVMGVTVTGVNEMGVMWLG